MGLAQYGSCTMGEVKAFSKTGVKFIFISRGSFVSLCYLISDQLLQANHVFVLITSYHLAVGVIVTWLEVINSLSSSICINIFNHLIWNDILYRHILSLFYEIALGWMPMI